MRYVVPFCFLAIIVSCGPMERGTNAIDLVDASDHYRIVQGHPIDLLWYVQITADGKHMCGGSLVTDRHVITAWHCVSGEYVDRDRLRFGGEIGLRYWGRPGESDFALVEIDRELESPPARIARVGPSIGDFVTVAGKGKVSQWGDVSKDLLASRVEVVDCGASAQYDDVFCVSAAGSGACYGDSGGPVIDTSGDLIGIVSYGTGYCGSGLNGYVAVWLYADWISQTTRSLRPLQPDR